MSFTQTENTISSIQLTFLPLSIASMSASVSLLRIQSMSCRCERSPAESLRRNPDNRLLMVEVPALGRAFRPSNNRTNKRSTSLMVSRQHLHNEFISYDNPFFKNLLRKISYKIFYNSRNCKPKATELTLCPTEISPFIPSEPTFYGVR